MSESSSDTTEATLPDTTRADSNSALMPDVVDQVALARLACGRSAKINVAMFKSKKCATGLGATSRTPLNATPGMGADKKLLQRSN